MFTGQYNTEGYDPITDVILVLQVVHSGDMYSKGYDSITDVD